MAEASRPAPISSNICHSQSAPTLPHHSSIVKTHLLRPPSAKRNLRRQITSCYLSRAAWVTTLRRKHYSITGLPAALRAAEGLPGRKGALLICLRRRLRENQMAAIRFAANPQHSPFSVPDLISDKPHNKSDSRFTGCVGI